MGWSFVVDAAFAGATGIVLDLARQCGDQFFQLVDFFLLFIDNLVEGIDGVLLVRQLQFDVNQAFFSHKVFPVTLCSASYSQPPTGVVWFGMRPNADIMASSRGGYCRQCVEFYGFIFIGMILVCLFFE